MEPKDLGESHEREDPFVRSEGGVCFAESVEGELEISDVFAVVLVFFLGEFFAQKANEGLPGFLAVAEGDDVPGLAEKGGGVGHGGREALGDFHKGWGESQLVGRFLKVPLMHQNGVCVQFGERVFGDLGGHERVAVAVATNPAREAEFRIGVVEPEVFHVPARVFPGKLQGSIEPQDDFGEGFREIREGVTKFFLDVGALDKNFSGIPKCLELGAERVGDATTVVGIKAGGFVVAEFFVDCLVPLSDRRTFCFGWVGGQNGFDADFLEGGDDIVFAQT